MISSQIFIVSAGIAGLVYGAFLVASILKKSEGPEKQRNISNAIRQGADAYLKRQYKTIAIIAVVPLPIKGSRTISPGFVPNFTGISTNACGKIAKWSVCTPSSF